MVFWYFLLLIWGKIWYSAGRFVLLYRTEKGFVMPGIKDVVVRKPSDAEIAECRTWPVWRGDVSRFDWDYTQTETCLLVEGKVTVYGRGEDKESVTVQAGDLAVFPEGLLCVWEIKEPVAKYFSFT